MHAKTILSLGTLYGSLITELHRNCVKSHRNHSGPYETAQELRGTTLKPLNTAQKKTGTAQSHTETTQDRMKLHRNPIQKSNSENIYDYIQKP